jgi:hypothetical protein
MGKATHRHFLETLAFPFTDLADKFYERVINRSISLSIYRRSMASTLAAIFSFILALGYFNGSVDPFLREPPYESEIASLVFFAFILIQRKPVINCSLPVDPRQRSSLCIRDGNQGNIGELTIEWN